MKPKIKGKVPSPRKDMSVKFRCGSGWHQKSEKVQRSQMRVNLKKGQEIFQSAS